MGWRCAHTTARTSIRTRRTYARCSTAARRRRSMTAPVAWSPRVMPALDAASRGDVFITVTGSRRVLRREHFERMKDGAVLANAGHFDVEIDLEELRSVAEDAARTVRPLVEQYVLADGRRLNLLA